MSSQTFANNIIRTQRTFGLSLTDLSAVIGTSRWTLARIKQANANYTPTAETIETIADAYGVASTEVKRRLPASVIASFL